jgi:hypothetical protein
VTLEPAGVTQGRDQVSASSFSTFRESRALFRKRPAREPSETPCRLGRMYCEVHEQGFSEVG